MDEAKIYQRIGEFVVSFQWIENRIREIGWFILDPSRKDWPPMPLRNLSGAALFSEVRRLFLAALPNCQLDSELEDEFKTSFATNALLFEDVRRARNRILHSTFIELKAGGELQELLRSNPRVTVDAETGELLFDQEMLSEQSFQQEFEDMARLAFFFNRCYIQLIHRLPQS